MAILDVADFFEAPGAHSTKTEMLGMIPQQEVCLRLESACGPMCRTQGGLLLLLLVPLLFFSASAN